MKPYLTIFRFLLLVAIIWSAGTVQSQTFEEYKKKRNADFEAFKKQETEAMKQLQADYDQWVEKRDKEFADYLENAFEEFQLKKELKRPDSPKPDVIPEFEEESVERENFSRMPVISTDPIRETPKEIPRIKPVIQKSEPIDFRKFDLTFPFYGVPVMVDYDEKLKIPAPDPVSNSSITGWWKQASETNYNYLINQLLSHKKEMALNDWGYYKLVFETCKKIQGSNKNSINLMAWFLLNRTGYNTKIAYANTKTTLLIASEQTMYGRQYFTINGIDFYIMEPLGTNLISTYARDYYDATRFFDFRIDQPLNLGGNIKTKNIRLQSPEQVYEINLRYDQFAIDFYEDYPQVNLEVYFDAPVSPETKESIVTSLTPFIQDKSPSGAINFLLNFVQNGFNYKQDQGQFGYEKYFFPEETIHYPYSDCEDRSTLFAYLVKQLLGYRIIGLRYDGHVSTAVKFPANTEVNGSYYIFKDEKYIVADPTYINAPAGLVMPQYKASEASVIQLATVNYSDNQDIDYWELAEESGGHLGSNLNNSTTDIRGNSYLTGYYIKEANFSDIVLKSDNLSRTAFVTAYDKTGNVKWAYSPAGKAISTGMSITLDNEMNIMVSGSFAGTLYLGGFTLKSRNEKPDVFVAKLDPNGKLMWAGQAGLDSLDQKSFMKYIVKYDRAGNYLGRDLYLENNQKTDDGIYTDEEGITYLAGTFHNTTGFNVNTALYNDAQSLDYVVLLKNETDLLASEKVNQGILGLFAVINIIKNNGMVIPGDAAQKALDRYNPDFRQNCKDLYEKIGRINFIRNSDGIITLITENEDPVLIDKIKVYHGSTVKITSLQNGDEQLDVLSGIKVGKLFVWYDLNYIQMYRETGNMLFDYDDDHTQALVNVTEDILN